MKNHPEYKKRVLMITTQTPGLNWYRMVSFARKMKRVKPKMWPPFFPDKVFTWENDLKNNRNFSTTVADLIFNCDVVVMQRVATIIGAAVVISLAKEYRRKLYVEIDDYAFNIDSCNPGFLGLRSGEEGFDAFKAQLRECDGIIVSTDNLRVKYQQFCMNEFGSTKDIRVVKNSIDFGVWDKLSKPKKNVKKVKIGWQGSHHHFDDLKLLMDIVPKILRKHKNVEFHFLGLLPEFLKQDRVFFHQAVSIKDYPKKMIGLNLDIILAPLFDTEFNRGKSNLRILEAGAMRKAVIASGNKNLPYASTIQDGRNGYLVNSSNEWIKAIESLIGDKKKRNMFGDNLYKKVKKEYNVKDTAQYYESLLLK